jgi:CBS domain-containing protein
MKALPSCPVADMPGRDSTSGQTAVAGPGTRIADVMTPDPIAIDVSASIGEATRVMLDYRVGALPVVHRGLLAGIITHADLVTRLAPRKRVRWWAALIDPERLARECQRARGTTVGEVMTRPALFVAPDDAIEAAVSLLRDSGIGRLPVVDHGRLVGIVSHSDLLRALSGAPRAEARPDDALAPEAGARRRVAARN